MELYWGYTKRPNLYIPFAWGKFRSTGRQPLYWGNIGKMENHMEKKGR